MKNLFEIALQVSSPLTLGGLFAIIMFLIIRQILSKNIFPVLTKGLGYKIISLIINRIFMFLAYIFLLALFGYVIFMAFDYKKNSKTTNHTKFAASNDLNPAIPGSGSIINQSAAPNAINIVIPGSGNVTHINSQSKSKRLLTIRISEKASPRWTTSTFIGFELINSGSGLIVVDSIEIKVIETKEILTLKEFQSGAPVIPIKGLVTLGVALGSYRIEFISNGEKIKKFSYKENDIDSFLVEVKGREGTQYKCHLIVKYVYGDKTHEQIIAKSDSFKLYFPYSSPSEALQKLD